MAAALPELAPEGAVVIRALIFTFGALAGFTVAWGVIHAMDALTRWVFGTASGAVGWIPFAGKVLSQSIVALEHKLTSFLGGYEAYFEKQMAVRFHQSAELVERWARDAQEAATLSWRLAHQVAYLYGLAATGKAWPVIKQYIDGQLARLHGVTKIVVHTTTVVEHATVGPIGAGIATKLRPFARALEGVIEWDLPHIRARERALSDELARLWRFAHRKSGVIAAGIGLAALVAALGRLGLGFLRCSNVKRAGRALCGTDPTLLESLLADAVLIVGAVSIVDFTASLVGIEDEVVKGLKLGFRELHEF